MKLFLIWCFMKVRSNTSLYFTINFEKTKLANKNSIWDFFLEWNKHPSFDKFTAWNHGNKKYLLKLRESFLTKQPILIKK